MDQTGGSDTPDSGIYSPDNGSRRSSMSSTDQSNGLHSRRSSTDSGLGGFMSNPSRDGKDARFSTSLDAQKVVSALTGNSTMTEEGIMPEITEGLEANNLTSASRTTTLRSGLTTSDSNLRSKRSTTTAQSIQVYATGPNNKTMPLNIKTSDSVDTLIQHMSRAFALGSSQNTYLVFEGQTLNLGSGLTVEKARIKNNSQMQLCTRVLGG